MAKDSMDKISAEFSRWVAAPDRKLSGEPAADEAEVELLLGLVRDQLGLGDPAQLKPGDLEELLLDVYPRKVTVFDAEDTRDTIPALRDLLAFLTSTGRLTEPAARRLGRELDQVAPRFAEAVMDPSRWGMARSLTQAMVTDGVDIADTAAVQNWIAAYNSNALETQEDWDVDEENENLKDAFGLPDRLPAIRLPALDELAALARKSPLLAAVARLAEWSGPRRAVDSEGELTATETIAAAAELGIEIGDPAAVTAIDDVPELVHLWELALDAGFLEEAGDDDDPVVAAGEAARRWHSGTDLEALAIWSEALTFLMAESLELDAELDEELGGDLDFYGAGMGLVTALFLARGEGVLVALADEVIREGATGDLSAAEATQTWAAWTQAHGEPTEVLLRRLAELGAVRLDDEEEGPVTRLTPLGSWAVREELIASGVDVPLLPPPAEMTAADLAEVAEGGSEEEFAAESDAWLALREPDAAARELLDFAAAAAPAERMTVVTVVRRLGDAAEPRWRAALDVPALRPYAKMALTDIADAAQPGLEPEPGDMAWLLVDLLAAAPEEFEPGELAAELAETIPSGAGEVMFDAMSRLPHPDAAAVLTLIGEQHPDKKTAKAARRFAYKAASRLNSAR
ncbi:MAG: hypothetical protein ABSB59_22040 [Streptosporangiaceae bacterium]|jgi:hypothetical protein